MGADWLYGNEESAQRAGLESWLNPEILRNFPVSIIPGNHDRFCPILRNPGNTVFDEHFKRPQWSGKLNGVNVTEFMNSDAPEPVLAIISADFCLREKRLFVGDYFGKGEVVKETLEELRLKTIQKKDEGMAVAWMIHFCPDIDNLPFKPDAGSRIPRVIQQILSSIEKNGLRLEKEQDLLEVAAACGVKHVFFGHTHLRDEGRYFKTTDSKHELALNGVPRAVGMTLEFGAYTGFDDVEFVIENAEITKINRIPYILRQSRNDIQRAYRRSRIPSRFDNDSRPTP